MKKIAFKMWLILGINLFLLTGIQAENTIMNCSLGKDNNTIDLKIVYGPESPEMVVYVMMSNHKARRLVMKKSQIAGSRGDITTWNHPHMMGVFQNTGTVKGISTLILINEDLYSSIYTCRNSQ